MKRLGSSDSLGALMSICPNSTDQHDQGNNAMYTRSFQTMMDGYDEENCIDQGSCQLVGSEKKRRLSLDQVKALEKNFEVENKLEPERKVKLAQELGLQPRQVAVWFQNRRARWKTKQLERDYGLLKANYDGLKLNINKLQHDNEALMKEIRELKSKIKEDGNDSNSKLSVKDEGLRSDSGENPKPETPINFQLPKTDEDSTFASKNEIILGEPSAAFVDFKDGSSDSDSSAILNDENIANRNNDTNIPTGGAIINHSSPHDHRFLEIDQNINNFQFEEYKAFSAKNILGDHGHKQFVKIEEHNFFGEESCSTLFSDDQPPSLHWYEWN